MANFTHETLVNTTSTPLHSESDLFLTVFAASLALIMVAAIFGSGLLVAAVYRTPKLRTRTNMFILNLAFADIGVSIFCLPFSIVTCIEQKWIFGDILCQLNGFLNILFASTSMLTLTAIGVEKYFAIVKPLHKVITARRAALMIVWTWLQSLALATVPLLGITSYRFKPGLTQCSVQDPTSLGQIIHAFIVFLVTYLIPLKIMGFTYFNIFRSARRHTIRVRRTSVTDGLNGNTTTAQRQIAVTVFIMFVVFIFCWSPYFAYVIYLTVNRSSVATATRRRLGLASYWCAFLNSALDPYIYGMRNPQFKSSFKSPLTLICCWCWNLRMHVASDSHVSSSKESWDGILSNPAVNSSLTSSFDTQYAAREICLNIDESICKLPIAAYANLAIFEGDSLERNHFEFKQTNTALKARRSGLLTTVIANSYENEKTFVSNEFQEDVSSNFSLSQKSLNNGCSAFDSNHLDSENGARFQRNLDSIRPRNIGKNLQDVLHSVRHSKRKLRWIESTLIKPCCKDNGLTSSYPPSDYSSAAWRSSSTSKDYTTGIPKTQRKQLRVHFQGDVEAAIEEPSLFDSPEMDQKSNTRKIGWIESNL